jgi:hypothetical protein
MSIGEDWPTKYPWRFLPRAGLHPYVPPSGRNWLKNPARGPQNGYLDIEGNEWVPHPPPTGGDPDEFHWDVQHPDRRHTNVRPDGAIHHGDDNFP